MRPCRLAKLDNTYSQDHKQAMIFQPLRGGGGVWVGGRGYHYNRAVTRKCIKSAWSADLSPNDDIPFSRLFPRRPMYDNLNFVYHMYYITYKIKSKVQSDLAALLLSGHSCCYPYVIYIVHRLMLSIYSHMYEMCILYTRTACMSVYMWYTFYI